MQGQVRIDVRQLSAESRVMLRQYVLCIKQHSRRITQQKIARACGVSQPSVSRWLRAPQEFQVEIPPIIARRAAKKSAGKGCFASFRVGRNAEPPGSCGSRGLGVFGMGSSDADRLSRRLSSSIMGAAPFHGPVRDGKAWGRRAMGVRR